MAEHEAIGRFYTRSRKIPHLIGKTPQGARIIGGPYTLTQVAVFVAVAALMWHTRTVWFLENYLLSLVMIPATGLGLGYLVGRAPIGARNPLRALQGLWQAVSAPAGGVIAGQALRTARAAPHRYATDPVPEPVVEHGPAIPEHRPGPVPATGPQPGVSAVQALLAGGLR